MKNSDAPAVKREAEEDWGRERWRLTWLGQSRLAPKAYKFANIANIGTSREGVVSETRSVYC
jgi:hypothetical protein